MDDRARTENGVVRNGGVRQNLVSKFTPSFQLDVLGDHLCTCTAHSGAKKAHDWAVDQLADLFRTTHKVKTQQVVKSRGQPCGDIELGGYLVNAVGPVPLVLDLRIAHDRFGSSSSHTCLL